MENKTQPTASQTTIQRIMDPQSQQQRSGKGVQLAIGSAVALLSVCGAGIYAYHQLETKKIDSGDNATVVAASPRSPRDGTIIDESAPEPQRAEQAALDHATILPMENKLNGYIDCLNRFEDIRNAWGVYLSWREDGLQPPNCSERLVRRGMPPVYPDLAPECDALITAANSMPPENVALHLEGKKYVKLLHKALPLMKQMTRYYAKKQYRDDECLEGRIFHAQWLKLFEKLGAQEKTLRHMVTTQAQGALQACVDRTSDQPQKAALHAWALLVQHVQKTLHQFRIEANTTAPDLSAVAQSIKDMRQEIKTFDNLPEEMMDTHDAELFDELIMAASAFHEQNAGHTPGKKLLGTRIRNGVPVQVRTGSLPHVLDAFHNLLKRYNFHARNNCIMMTACNDDNTCPKR